MKIKEIIKRIIEVFSYLFFFVFGVFITIALVIILAIDSIKNRNNKNYWME